MHGLPRGSFRSIAAAIAIAAAVGAQGPAAAAARDPEIAALRAHPTAPAALRGATLCIAVTDDTAAPRVTRAAHYLARLCEAAGAAVAVVAEPDPELDAASIAADAGAMLLVGFVSAREGRDGATRPQRAADDPLGAFEDDLLARCGEPLRPRGVSPSPASGPPDMPFLQVLLAADPGPRSHREASHALFDAIVAWRSAQGAALRPHLPRPAARRAGAPRDADPLWPLDRPPVDAGEVATFLEGWRRARIVDPTQVYLQVRAERSAEGWRLAGATELPLLVAAVRRALEGIGAAPLEGDLRLLPDAERLGGPAFGIVRQRAAQTWRVPGPATGLRRVDPPGQFEETTLLPGEPIRLLDAEDGYLLVHAMSGYVGWVRGSAVERCDASRHRERLAALAGPSQGVARAAADRALAQLGTPYLFGAAATKASTVPA